MLFILNVRYKNIEKNSCQGFSYCVSIFFSDDFRTIFLLILIRKKRAAQGSPFKRWKINGKKY